MGCARCTIVSKGYQAGDPAPHALPHLLRDLQCRMCGCNHGGGECGGEDVGPAAVHEEPLQMGTACHKPSMPTERLSQTCTSMKLPYDSSITPTIGLPG